MKVNRMWAFSFAAAMCLPAAALAQRPTAPTSQPLPPKSYMSEGVFSLPIVISSRVRGNLAEVQLYSKTKPNQAWQLTKTVPPTSDNFVFRAPKQGEYWFTVVTIDRQGNRHPSNLGAEPPGLVVVFDKQAPTITLRALPDRPQGKCFSCRGDDTISGPVNTRVYYQTRDGVYRALEPTAGNKQEFCVPREAAFTGMLRIIATDMAGNTVSKETSIEFLTAEIPNVAKQMASKKKVIANSNPTPLPELPKIPNLKKVPALPPVLPNGPILSGVNSEKIKQVKTETPANGGRKQTTNIAKKPGPILPEHFPPPVPNYKQQTDVKPHLTKKNTVDTLPANPKPFRRQLVKKPHLALKYEIEDQGPSGVGKVEVYLTYDKGQSWQRYAEDTDRQSPVDIHLTTEGLVGVRLVVSNGRGFGGNTPRAGETPDLWVELDVTPPRAELHEIRPGSTADAGAFYISWTSTDKNTQANNVELFYAEKREGPWLPIAKGLPATGTYRWAAPSNAGARAFVRLATSDEAGNDTVAETPQPVVLDDLSRPRARVVGVVTTSPE